MSNWYRTYKSLNLPVRQMSHSNIFLVLSGHYAKALLVWQKTLLALINSRLSSDEIVAVGSCRHINININMNAANIHWIFFKDIYYIGNFLLVLSSSINYKWVRQTWCSLLGETLCPHFYIYIYKKNIYIPILMLFCPTDKC